MSSATIGHGTVLSISSTGWQAIEEIIDIDGPNREAALIDVTPHDDASGYRVYKQGLKDAGDVTFTCNFLPTATKQGLVRTAFTAGTTNSYKITWTDTGTTEYTFDAIVTGIQNTGANQDDQLTEVFTLKLTGGITVA